MAEIVGKVKSERTLEKSSTGSEGLDWMLHGGVPRRATTLVVGGPGAGKTVFGLSFLAAGLRGNEPGVLLSFEEDEEDLRRFNTGMDLGDDLKEAEDQHRFAVEHVRLNRQEVSGAEGGGYMELLHFRLKHAISRVGARRVFIDGLDTVFSSGFADDRVVRVELRRVFDALKDMGVTTVLSAERGTEELTRNGLEEYVADCVVQLDQGVVHDSLARRVRIVKYRGSDHALDAVPFVIDRRGITVDPYGLRPLDATAPTEQLATGVEPLDQMLAGGPFRGSTALVSGAPGTGKTSLVGACAVAACKRGERALFVSFEESPAQVRRNLSSIGMDIERWEEAGLLHIHSARPQASGVQEYLQHMRRYLTDIEPSLVVLDAIGAFKKAAGREATEDLLTMAADLFKDAGVTVWMTVLTHDADDFDRSTVGLSSTIDTWITLRNLESAGELNRTLAILKARGLPHSNQVREFVITDDGISLVDVYVGPDGVLTGSARVSQENIERLDEQRRQDHVAQLRRAVEQRARLAALQTQETEASARAAIDEVEARLKDALVDERMRENDVQRLRTSRRADRSDSGERSVSR